MCNGSTLRTSSRVKNNNSPFKKTYLRELSGSSSSPQLFTVTSQFEIYVDCSLKLVLCAKSSPFYINITHGCTKNIFLVQYNVRSIPNNYSKFV